MKKQQEKYDLIVIGGGPSGMMSGKAFQQLFTRRNRYTKSRHTPHQGAQECARRVRQMRSGMIRVAS